MKKVQLQKIAGRASGTLKISGSKSISNRVLIMAALSDTEMASGDITNLSNADDTERMEFYLNQINSCSRQRLPLVINAENAGTVMRFLASFLSVKKGNWLLTGSERMQKRPMGILVSALQTLGAGISYAGKTGFPPLRIKGGKLTGGVLEMDASVSSQFISSLMLVAPYAEKGLKINFANKPVSFPYIEMTKKLMEAFGARVDLSETFVKVHPSVYCAKPIYIEPDWSSASYWFEVASLAKDADIFLEGFTKKSVQGDSCVWQIFADLGVHTKFTSEGVRLSSSKKQTDHLTYDFTDAPDLVPSVLTTCAAKKITATVTGVTHLKYKESDRMQALANELIKIGAVLKLENDKWHLTFDKAISLDKKMVFETYKDHRMAMCFSPLVLKYDHITVKDWQVVEKSYPAFWDDLKKLNFVRVNS